MELVVSAVWLGDEEKMVMGGAQKVRCGAGWGRLLNRDWPQLL